MPNQIEAQEEAHDSTSRDRLAQLATHRNHQVRRAVAQNQATPVPLLEVLVDDRHHLVRFAVAQRNDPEAWSVALAADNPDVRVVLAQHHDLDDSVLDALMADPAREVRQSLATSSQREDVIGRLARDADHKVRASAATNLHINPRDIEALASDKVAQVRAVAAQSRVLTAETVTRLSRDRSGNVRYFALEAHPDRLDLARALLTDPEADVAKLAKRLTGRT